MKQNTNRANSALPMYLLQLVVIVIFSTVSSASLAAAPKLLSHWAPSDESSSRVLDHDRWQHLLDTYLDDNHHSGINRFNYAAVSSKDLKVLDDYLEYMQNVDPRTLSRAEQFSYWVNLYNAKTIELVTKAVQKNNIKSIKQIRSSFIWSGPWRMKSLEVSGTKVSLDDIEHGVLRPIWEDRRIHYVVNCASLGCPSLLKTALTAQNSQALLDVAQRDFLQHPRAVNLSGSKLVLSKIFSWYDSDFGGDENQLLTYISGINGLELTARKLEISYSYDWDLNAQDIAVNRKP